MKGSSESANAIIVVIGDELVAGEVNDQNAYWLAKTLVRLGFEIDAICIVRDDPDQVTRYLRRASRSASHVFVAGGLSATPDDVTRAATAAAFGVPLVRSRKVAKTIKHSGQWKDVNFALETAYFPRGARIIDSRIGGICGFVIGNTYVLPGAPTELRAMVRSLDLKGSSFPIRKRTLTYRLSEDSIWRALRAFSSQFPGVRLGSYPLANGRQARVCLTLRSRSPMELESAARWLRARIA